MKFRTTFLSSLAALALLALPTFATAQAASYPQWGTAIGESPITATDAATSTTQTVDLVGKVYKPDGTAYSATELTSQIAKGNIYYRVSVLTDGTVNGRVNFRTSTASNGSAAGTTAANTGLVVLEGESGFIRVTGRYLHYAGIGSDTDHTITATRVVPLDPN